MAAQDFLKSRLFTVPLLLVFSAVAFVTVKLYMQKREVDSEIARLQAQASELESGNKQLSELIKYLDTPEFKEKEAREKLNLKRPGEEVVVLPGEDEVAGLVAGAQSGENKPNPTKWYEYFFRIQ